MIIRTAARATTAAIFIVVLAACGGSGSPGDVAPGGGPPPASGDAPVLMAVPVVGAENVQIANFVLVGTTRISRTVFEYTYRADVTNGDTAPAAITATLASSAATTAVVDGVLDFGDVAPGATKTSLDTFSIRQDRSVPFDQNALTWTVQATSATAAGLLLEEVLYLPAAGSVPFIELTNFGADPVALETLTVMVGDAAIPLERAGTELAPGARLVILLDGQLRADGLTYHAGSNVTISPDAGTVTLFDDFGGPVDEVAWGAAPRAVSPVAGGFYLDVEPGTSIGRVPGVQTPRNPQAWVAYPPGEASPGAANPPATVRALHPQHGATVARSTASLSWFPVPGATSYRVQVAPDETFSILVLDTEVAPPRVDVSGLPAGRLVWRVQSEFAGGTTAPFSTPSVVHLADQLVAARSFAAAANSPTMLPVQLLQQHKDTKLLMLERPVADGPHAWDNDHQILDEDDPADNKKCMIASLTMMNNYARDPTGTSTTKPPDLLSQDRIAFEVFKDLWPNAELDLGYDRVLYGSAEIAKAYQFALGTTESAYAVGGVGNVESFWNIVKQRIDINEPILAAVAPHAWVIKGYSDGPPRIIYVADPWRGLVDYDIDDIDGRAAVADWRYWLNDGPFVPTHQEPEVSADSDGDGVYDFDETQRFHTNPHVPDTDNDGVRDKQDIYASVFDIRRGYAEHRTTLDWDHDYLYMELDSDSDSGGCKDGQEDVGGDGIFDVILDTWNFDQKDDACQDLSGHLTYNVHQSGSVDAILSGTRYETTTISARLEPDPGHPGNYRDAGSTFRFVGRIYQRYDYPQCQILVRNWADQGGDFTGPNASPGTAEIFLDGSGRLAVHFEAAIDPANTGGWAGSCGGFELRGLAGDGFSARFPGGDCLGVPVAGAPSGHKTFTFSCQESGWDASGSLTVVAP